MFGSDHFTIKAEVADQDALELVLAFVGILYTQRVHFGSLVAPLTFRDPVMLARQAVALDHLSQGRMILGVGAGDFEPEHTMFGYPFEDISTRFARLAEGLEVITHLLRDPSRSLLKDASTGWIAPATCRGRSAPAAHASSSGATARRGNLPLAGRHADIWNAFWLTADEFRQRAAVLDDLVDAAGRQPATVRRTVTLFGICGRDTAELQRSVRVLRRWQAHLSTSPLDEVLSTFRSRFHALVGTPEEVVDQIGAYAAAGAEEVIVHWLDPDDVAGLHLLAEQVLPQVMAT